MGRSWNRLRLWCFFGKSIHPYVSVRYGNKLICKDCYERRRFWIVLFYVLTFSLLAVSLIVLVSIHNNSKKNEDKNSQISRRFVGFDYTTNKKANVYKSPNKKSTVKAVLEKGNKIKIITTKSKFYEILYIDSTINSQQGYISINDIDKN